MLHWKSSVLSGVSGRRSILFWLLVFAWNGTCKQERKRCNPSNSAVKQTLESPQHVTKDVSGSQSTVTPATPTPLLPPHPTCGVTCSRRATAPCRSRCFSHLRLFINPMPWEHTTFLGMPVSQIMEVNWELVLVPRQFRGLALLAGGRDTCTSEEKTVAQITWPKQSHRGLLICSEKLLFWVDTCVFAGLQRLVSQGAIASILDNLKHRLKEMCCTTHKVY